MNRSELPEGVPPTNESLSGNGGSFGGPDVATPNFTNMRQAKTTREKREIYERVVEEDDDENNQDQKCDDEDEFLHLHDHGRPSPIMLIFAIALLLAALGAIVVANNRQPTPLCSEQPSWNQYNCRPG